jgi:hypothetical protein
VENSPVTDTCPFKSRVFFENAGGALTLNAAVETSRSSLDERATGHALMNHSY